jgi:hypothetical protein
VADELGGPAGLDDLVAALDGWVRQARHGRAAGARARRRWLEHQAAEEETLASAALALAQRRARVVLRAGSGRCLSGWAAGLGPDFIALAQPPAGLTLVSLRLATSLATAAGEPPGPARPLSPCRSDLAGVLDAMSAERPRVALGLRACPEPVVGRLVSVGADVARLSVGPPPGRPAWVQLEAVSEVSPLGSG